MKKLIIIALVLLSACSEKKEVIKCKRAFLLDSIVVLSQRAMQEDNSENTLIGMCMLAKTYKETDEIINELYDSYEGNQYVFDSYFKKQVEECRKKTYPLEQTLDIALKGNDFRKKYMNVKCSDLLDLDYILKPH